MIQTEEISVGPIWPLKMDLIHSKEIISPKAEVYTHSIYLILTLWGKHYSQQSVYCSITIHAERW
jgi:hypothetical protein